MPPRYDDTKKLVLSSVANVSEDMNNVTHQVPSEKYAPLTTREESFATLIVDAAFKVHKRLGPGLLERIYEVCFCYELEKLGLNIKRQVNIPIRYDDLEFDEGLRLDVLVEDSIICELKAVDKMNPVWTAQVLSHLRMLDKRLGFLINFNVPKIKDGLKRIIL